MVLWFCGFVVLWFAGGYDVGDDPHLDQLRRSREGPDLMAQQVGRDYPNVVVKIWVYVCE